MAINKEVIQRLYHQSVGNMPAGGGNDAWAWEVEFAKAIVLECSRVAKLQTGDNKVCDAIEQHFGVEQ